jgi:fructose transport system substrate-binding protein
MQRRTRLARRILIPLALLSSATLALAACGGGGGNSTAGGSASGGGDKPVSVTLITKTATNPFFIAMQQGAEQAGKDNNVKVTTVAGKADGDEQTQIDAIEAAIARGDQGILITPATDAVAPKMQEARDAGLYVIALDTPPNPASAADITFATDNFQAGTLIGKWMAGTLNGSDANIALLDLFNDKVASVDYNRDQGFLTGMGINVNDPKKNGDEAPTGKYTGGKGGNYSIVCNEPTQGATDQGKTAMETCLAKSKNINTVYTINEPAAVGASQALNDAGVKATIVSVDGGCDPGIKSVKSGIIGATSQQYPVKMAQLGVEAIAKYVRTGEKPAVSPGLDFYNTGVQLVTDKPVSGVPSITTADAEKICWGAK